MNILQFCFTTTLLIATVCCKNPDPDLNISGGWQFYTEGFYWEVYFYEDSMLLFNDVLIFVPGVDYQYDKSTRSLQIFKNNTTMFSGEMEHSRSDGDEVIFNQNDRNEKIFFYQILSDQKLADKRFMMNHMESFYERKLKFIEDQL